MRRKRREYSQAERKELWERWKRGETISDIARALDRAPGTIHCTIREQGGVVPRERRRSRLALTLAEREEISRAVAAGESARRVAARLGRSPSTVSRELARCGGRRRYRAADAEPVRLGARAAAASLQARPQSRLVCTGRREARGGLVAGADRRLAESPLSGGSDSEGVARDDLPDLVHPGAGSVAARVDRPLAQKPFDPPAAQRIPRQSRPGPDRRCRLDPRAARGGGGPCDPRTLGR